jgi:hypothetical protein
MEHTVIAVDMTDTQPHGQPGQAIPIRTLMRFVGCRMKNVLFGIGLLLIATTASATWTMNPFTGKLDYYEFGLSSRTTPTLSGCGTSPTITTGSNDHVGKFVIGSTGTGCIVTFGTAYAADPACLVSANTITNLTSRTTTSIAITVVGLPDTYSYLCTGLVGTH